MIMTTRQKIIKIGSSKGVTLPAKQLKQLGVEVGDEVELIVRKQNSRADSDVIATASAILDRYDDDFKNLANR